MDIFTHKNTRYLIRRLETIHKIHYDPPHRVYILDVTYQGSPIRQTIILPEIFLLPHTHPSNSTASTASMPLTSKQQQKVEKDTVKVLAEINVKEENALPVLGSNYQGWLLDGKGEEFSWGSEQRIVV